MSVEHRGAAAGEFRKIAGGADMYSEVMMDLSWDPHWDQVKNWSQACITNVFSQSTPVLKLQAHPPARNRVSLSSLRGKI